MIVFLNSLITSCLTIIKVYCLRSNHLVLMQSCTSVTSCSVCAINSFSYWIVCHYLWHTPDKLCSTLLMSCILSTHSPLFVLTLLQQYIVVIHNSIVQSVSSQRTKNTVTQYFFAITTSSLFSIALICKAALWKYVLLKALL